MRPPLLVWLLIGCGSQPTIRNPGVVLWDWFPLEPGRTWTYHAGDRALVATRGDAVEEGGDVYPVDYEPICDPACETLRVEWSSTAELGVRIHAAELAGERVDYVPPIQIARGVERVGDTWVTPTAGREWRSALEGLGPCDDAPDDDDCAWLTLSHDGPDDALLPITTLQVAEGTGAVTLGIADDTWRLSELDCGTCDGEW